MTIRVFIRNEDTDDARALSVTTIEVASKDLHRHDEILKPGESTIKHVYSQRQVILSEVTLPTPAAAEETKS